MSRTEPGVLGAFTIVPPLTLTMALQQGLIQGRGAMALGDVIRKRFDVSQNEANRLMITELARVQTEAQKNLFEENGYDEYEFIALGAAACPDCAALDGRHFKVKDMQIGLNAPPMHPNCRCSIAAWMARDEQSTDKAFYEKTDNEKTYEFSGRNDIITIISSLERRFVL